ncbi:MAG: Holliday junction resolvase RuvX [Bacteroidales bacterium]
MGRILSIDYGSKRTGLAVTDILKIAANPLATVPSTGLMDYLAEYFIKEDVELVVIGAPRQTNNMESENMPRVQLFINKFEVRFPSLPIVKYDERYTSVLAHRAMIDGGVKRSDRRDKALVDRISAVIILQSYLESIHYKKQI